MSDKNNAIDLSKLAERAEQAAILGSDSACRIALIEIAKELSRQAAPVAPTAWMCKTGHGTGWRETAPPADIAWAWTPLFASPATQQAGAPDGALINEGTIAATTASASIQKLDLTDYSQAVNYSNNTRTAIIAPAPSQEAQAAHAGAVDEQQSNVPPPFAAPADQQCASCRGRNPHCTNCDGMGIEPRKIDHYAACKCTLPHYCDGKCNPVWADELASRCRAQGGETNTDSGTNHATIATSEQKGPQA
jgi:hypothetical protein